MAFPSSPLSIVRDKQLLMMRVTMERWWIIWISFRNDEIKMPEALSRKNIDADNPEGKLLLTAKTLKISHNLLLSYTPIQTWTNLPLPGNWPSFMTHSISIHFTKSRIFSSKTPWALHISGYFHILDIFSKKVIWHSMQMTSDIHHPIFHK